MKRIILAAVILAACKSPAPPSSFGVNVTIDATMIDAAARAEIATAALSVSGAESYSRTFDISAAIADGRVRFRYIPGVHSGMLTLTLDALARDGSLVAAAAPQVVTVSAGHSVGATLTLGVPAASDMATADAADGGATTCDPGLHLCGGSCVDNTSLDSCGSSCTACPVPANASAATCDGTSCGVQCNPGYHACGGACVSDSDANSCNLSCTPCTPPSGGTATCDGTACGGSCPDGQKLCLGVCIPSGMACNGSCPAGTHECSGNCFDDGSVNSCGASCTPCTVPAHATMATCSGGSCGFVCDTGYEACGSACIPSTSCCTNADCAQPANGVATCDTTTNQCVIACNSNYTKCGSECISATACCMSSDCAQPTNGSATCNADHMCVATCNSPYDAVCGGACVDTTSDNANCGACGTTCGGQCSLSRCSIVLASGQKFPISVGISGTSVYWANSADVSRANGAIMAVPVAGGTVSTVAQGITPSSMALDSTSVYWASNGYYGSAAVLKAPLSGGASTTLTSMEVWTGDLAVDAISVYYAVSRNPNDSSTLAAIKKVPVGGGSPITIATLPSGDDLGGMAVDSTSAYWGDVTAGTIMKVSLSGGSPTTVASGQTQPKNLAADGTNVYWFDYVYGSPGTLMRVSVNGGTPTILASGQDEPGGIAVDGVSVYWIDGYGPYAKNPGSIMKISRNGGTPTVLASGLSSPVGLAVDGTSIYWASDSASGAIMRLTPK